jgi:plastocyanin
MRSQLVGLLIGCSLLLCWQAHPVTWPATVDLPGLVLVGDNAEPNVVVWLEAPDAPRQPHEQKVVMDQRNLAFDPTVLATSVGSTVEFPNNDRVLHNVFSFHDGEVFDLGLYPVGQVRRITFDQAGVSWLFCNIHPAMAAYIVVVESPYSAVTDREGAFVIRDVPPGRYAYHAWRAGSSTVSDTVTVDPNARLDVRWPAR